MTGSRNEKTAASAARVHRVLPANDGWVPTGGTLTDDSGEDAAEPEDADADDRSPPAEPPEPEPPEPEPPEPEPRGPVALPPPSLAEALRAAMLDRVPPTLRGARIGPGRRGWRALLVVAVLAVLVSGALWWRSRSVPSALPPVAVHSASSGTATSSDARTPTARLIVVDVVGKVRHPGIVRLPDGARVYDAIRAAGGLKPHADTTGLNLARKLVDGEQIVVGAPAASTGVSPPGAGPSSPAPGAKVDLNAATLEQLDELPGVGPVLAQRILDYRTKIGRFTSVSQLNQVSGIGPARYADLEPLVRV